MRTVVSTLLHRNAMSGVKDARQTADNFRERSESTRVRLPARCCAMSSTLKHWSHLPTSRANVRITMRDEKASEQQTRMLKIFCASDALHLRDARAASQHNSAGV